ncbi:MAG: zinc ribbon domain-containing protein [Ignavibacteria bacterium]|nr:zinc ribbon domain-containing protein [Ignavibacteria bacterium]
MPIYEYKCERCGKVFEYQQKITDEPLEYCPPEICESKEFKGQGKVHRIISKGVGLIFKGNGFYITDYARKNSSVSHSGNFNETQPRNGASSTQKVNSEQK